MSSFEEDGTHEVPLGKSLEFSTHHSSPPPQPYHQQSNQQQQQHSISPPSTLLDADAMADVLVPRHAASDQRVAPIGVLLFQQAVDRSRECDLTVLVGRDEVPFAFHSAVFVARSPVLRVMLNSGMRESQTSVVRFPTLSVACFEALRRFMYTGSLHIPPFTMEEMIRFCDAYCIDGASYLLADVLAETLSVHNCAFALHTAWEHQNLVKLRSVALQFACDHLPQVLAADSRYLNTNRVIHLVQLAVNNEFVPASISWISAAAWAFRAEQSASKNSNHGDDSSMVVTADSNGTHDDDAADDDDADDDDADDAEHASDGEGFVELPNAATEPDDVATRANKLFAVLRFDRLDSEFMAQLINSKADEPLSVFRRLVPDFQSTWAQQAVALLAKQEFAHKESRWYGSAPFGDDYTPFHQHSDTMQRGIFFHSMLAHPNWSHEEMRLSAYHNMPMFQKNYARVLQRSARAFRRPRVPIAQPVMPSAVLPVQQPRLVFDDNDGDDSPPLAGASLSLTTAASSTSATTVAASSSTIANTTAATTAASSASSTVLPAGSRLLRNEMPATDPNAAAPSAASQRLLKQWMQRAPTAAQSSSSQDRSDEDEDEDSSEGQ
jgi:hypothetical protein